MKKIFNFGKIDFDNVGRDVNIVTVECEYTTEKDQKRFTASGNIWNASRRDVICGGQCLDTIAEYIKTPLFMEILRLWRLYHLNDMHPECEHQAAAGWREKAREEVKIYTYTTTTETSTEQRSIKNEALAALKRGEMVKLDSHQIFMLTLNDTIKTPDENLPANLAKYYKLGTCLNRLGVETKTLGWLHPDEHPDGILGKPCPVCGYKYGTAWKYFSIPENDEKIIYSIFDGTYNG